MTYYFVYLDTELYVRWRVRKRTQVFIKLLFIVIVRLVAASSGSGKKKAVFHCSGAWLDSAEVINVECYYQRVNICECYKGKFDF